MSETLTTQAPQKLSPTEAIRINLEKMKPQFQMALPSHINVDKFQRTVMTAVQLDQGLLECTPQSLYAACMQAAQQGLLPDRREAAIVKFGDKAQFLPMFAGKMKKARNSGEVATWSLQVVCENDEFDYAFGDEEYIKHKPAKTDRGKVIGAYSIVTMRSGEKSREYMSVEEIEKIRKRSKSADRGPWVTDFEEMAKKTVGGRHSKRLPSSTDFMDKLGIMEEPEPSPELHAEPEHPSVPSQPAPQTSSRLASVVAAQAPAPVVITQADPNDLPL